MNRETLIAIFLGFAGGILVAFLLIAVPKKIPKINKTAISPTPKQEQITQEPTQFAINSPEDGLITTESEVTVSGTAPNGTQIVINGPSDDKVLTVDKEGKFESKISVYEGENIINITAYSENSSPLSEIRKVYTTTQEL